MKLLGDAPGEPECWTSGWRGMDAGAGQVQIYAFKQAGKHTGVACFLVDRGVAGLKDTFHLSPCPRSQLTRMLEDSREAGFPMRRATVAEVRATVGAAARWATEHGLRLPQDWTKTAQLIGGVGDWKSADTSEFIRKFAGHREDLRARLVGETIDSFLDREDIVFEFSDRAVYMDQRTGRYIEPGTTDDLGGLADQVEMAEKSGQFRPQLRALEAAATSLAGKTRQSLGDVTSPDIEWGWRVLLTSMVFGHAFAGEEAAGAESFRTRRNQAQQAVLDQLIRSETARGRQDVSTAVEQALHYFRDHGDEVAAVLSTVTAGLGDPPPRTT